MPFFAHHYAKNGAGNQKFIIPENLGFSQRLKPSSKSLSTLKGTKYRSTNFQACNFFKPLKIEHFLILKYRFIHDSVLTNTTTTNTTTGIHD